MEKAESTCSEMESSAVASTSAPDDSGEEFVAGETTATDTEESMSDGKGNESSSFDSSSTSLRRSNRAANRRKVVYTEEEVEDDGSDEDAIDSDPFEDAVARRLEREIVVPSLIERILGFRFKEEDGTENDDDPYEYLVKWRNYSYLHLDWISSDSVVADKNGSATLQRFHRKLHRSVSAKPPSQSPKSIFFNPMFGKIDRIVGSDFSVSWKDSCIKILNSLQRKRVNGYNYADPFLFPVDPVKDGVPDYFDVVKNPMDFSTVRANLHNKYENHSMFATDMRLIFENCRLYNHDENNDTRIMGDVLSKTFEEKYAALLEEEAGDEVAETSYEVKWRGLPYSQTTWEKESFLIENDTHAWMKIANFRRCSKSTVKIEQRCQHRKTKKSDEKDKDEEPYSQSPFYKGGRRLREYQVDALNWILSRRRDRVNCILADEMGLGKTISTLAVLNHVHSSEVCCWRPSLIVAPLSTIRNWEREIRSWIDLNVIVYHDAGGADGRELIREKEFYFDGGRECNGLYRFDLIITTYEIAVTDAEFLSHIPFQYIVVDEAQRLKNMKSRLAVELMKFTRSHVLLLTGTPLQNNITELWSLLYFLHPRKFHSLDDFLAQYGEMRSAKEVLKLQKLLRKYMLRRVKNDVELSIPPKQETIVDVELTTLQKTYYRAIYEKNRNFLSSSMKGNRGPTLLNVEMELRKCCNHPFLIKGAEDRTVSENCTPSEWLETLIDSSGKMVLLDKLLPKLKEEGHRILLFSQMTKMLDLIEDYCFGRDFHMERIDGSVTGVDRQLAIDRFNDPASDSFIFLLSTRAGGVGINLTSADTCIIFDSDWNPQNDLQAMARCHRLGQKKQVKIYRLITRNTYEACVFETASKKLGLEQAVLSSKKEKSKKKPDRKEIENLLKHGAYGILLDDGEDAERQRLFREDNIDDLLARNSHIVTVNENEQNGLSKLDLTFSKTRFASQHADANLDVNADDFWDQVLGVDARDTLLTRLNDGSFSRNKKAYLEEVIEVAKQVVEAKLEGEFPKYYDTVISVLTQITALKGSFNKDQRKKADHWLKEVERPTRKRRTVKTFGMNGKDNRSDLANIFSDDSDDDYVDERTKRRMKRSGPRKERKFGTTVSSRSPDEVCVMCCDTGGTIVLCDGPCMRSIHLECLEKTQAEVDQETKRNGQWYCPDCTKKVQMCFVCGESGPQYNPRIHNKDGTIKKRKRFGIVSDDSEEDEDEEESKNEEIIAKREEENKDDDDKDNTTMVLEKGEESKMDNGVKANSDPVNGECCLICGLAIAGTISVSINKGNLSGRVHFKKCLSIFKEKGVPGDKENEKEEEKSKVEEAGRRESEQKDISLAKKNIEKKDVKRKNDETRAVFPCQMSNCGRFYHLDCVLANELTQRSAPPHDENFRCPQHYCKSCGLSGNGRLTVRCLRCPTAYHVSQNCVPGLTFGVECLRLAKTVMLCERHSNIPSRGRTKSSRRSRSSRSSFSSSSRKSRRNSSSKSSRRTNAKKLKRKRPSRSKSPSRKSKPKPKPKPNSKLKSKPKPFEWPDINRPPPKKKVKRAPRPPSPPPSPIIYTTSYAEHEANGHGLWCRYCGARESSGWSRGPWGSKTLCVVHYVAWWQKKRLNLSKYKELPTEPINPDANTEPKYRKFLKKKERELKEARERAIERGEDPDAPCSGLNLQPDPYARAFDTSKYGRGRRSKERKNYAEL
eukprot:g2345.t1